MEHIATCTVCGWDEAWTTRAASEAAAVVHVHDEHPDIWAERMGEATLPVSLPSAYGRKFEDWERQSVRG